MLLIGGETASAEIFDPDTDTFTPTGVMSTARTKHVSELLRDALARRPVPTTSRWGLPLGRFRVYEPGDAELESEAASLLDEFLAA